MIKLHSLGILTLLIGLIGLTGCTGAPYRMGTASLYPQDIQTIYVPMIESDSFRPFLGERLTEAVTRRISDGTTFTLVNDPNADSVLSVRLVSDTKRLLVENVFDDPRESQINMQVLVSWTTRRGELIRESSMPLPQAIDIGASSDIVPEFGRSMATAQQEVIDRLANQIVGMMEVPW
ncbi:MAG: LPS assembly lipoprotein LptE [Planctomycetota bacterium]|nr:LPS assembly lipoprotein LptE [Planctomycetota bacterium]